MKETLLIPSLSKEQIIPINLVRIKLNCIFISYLLKYENNRIQESYSKGHYSYFLVSIHKWTLAKLSKES